MDLVTIPVDTQKYFQMGKDKISEGMEHLHYLVQWYNRTPEKVGLLDEIVAYLQSLQRQVVQEIESLAQRGEARVSSNINTTNLHHGQHIAQIREQNEGIEMVMNAENPSCSKRKKRSDVWNDFLYYEDKDGKKVAECNHCERKFDGSSKKGTTHLKNHLKSCQGLRNPGGVAKKSKEKSVINPELDGSELAGKIIKFGLNRIKNDILDVYQQEKDKLRGYLDKLPCRFNVTIELLSRIEFKIWLMRIWFIDDSWQLKNMVICLGKDEDVFGRVKSSLVDWNIDKKICSIIHLRDYDETGESCDIAWEDDYEMEEGEGLDKICKWLNKRGSLLFAGNCLPFSRLSEKFYSNDSNDELTTKLSKLQTYFRRNENKFQSAVEKVVSMGKKVTSQSLPLSWEEDVKVLEWVIGCKEVFCELEHIDDDFKFFNFIKGDWDVATLKYSYRKELKELKDWGKDAHNLHDPKYKTANAYFPMICPIISKLVQSEKTENQCFHKGWREDFALDFDEHWNKSELVLAITLILDPRFKTNFAEENFYKEIYGKDAKEHYRIIIGNVKKTFKKYAKCVPSSSSAGGEFNRYLMDPRCGPGERFDILEWWLDNSSTYPTLARMARDFLSIPIFATPVLKRFLAAEIEDEISDEFKWKLACTRIWLNNLEHK